MARDLKGIKKTISDFAIEIMNRSSTPVLPLPRLVDAIAEETAGHMADPERILAEIRSRPDLFCVLDPLIGPWHRATAEPGETPPGEPGHLGPRPLARDPRELSSMGPDRGESTVSRKKGRRRFGNRRGTLGATD